MDRTKRPADLVLSREHHSNLRAILSSMCGIAGTFAYHYAANPADRSEVDRMRDSMASRGPDGAGTWQSNDGRVALAHRRLSIIDLTDTGAQPMVKADGAYVITFNGEIFNYLALRRDLEDQGHVFSSESDTEVLLHLYAAKGPSMVHDLRGMFALAIWDVAKRELFLARDAFGIKPLYYADDGWTFRFASQVKALCASSAISRDPDPAGWVGFYLFGSVPEPFTTYRAIRQVPAGHWVKIDRLGVHAPQRYHSIAETYSMAEAGALPARDHGEATREALLDSVRHHLVADVPVGAFLSAGADSGALVGLMRDAGQADIQTVTINFEEFLGTHNDEAPLAERVAATYNTRHVARTVTEHEFRADLPRILDAMDQPSIDGVNTWFVSKAARELGLKVAISGLGGDELFGGYPSFGEIPRWVRWLAVPSRVPLLGRATRHLALAVGTDRLGANPKIAGMVELGGSYAGAYLLRRGLFMSWELDQLLDADMVREGLRRLNPLSMIDTILQPRPRQPFSKVATLESSLYMRNQLLRDTDWASMAHGLEVRVPLVDRVLLERVSPITSRAANAGKAALVASPRVALPRAIAERAKTGFTTPVGSWLQKGRVSRSCRQIPALVSLRCPWARKWACSVAAA